MVFCVAWGTCQFARLDGKPDAPQAEVDNVIYWAFAPYAIGRALMREIAAQRDE